MLNPRRAKAGDAREHARLVLHEDRQDVLAAGADPAAGLEVLEAQDLLGAWLAHRSAHHVAGGLARRDHRVAVLLGETRTSTSGAILGQRLLEAADQLLLSSIFIPRAPNASASFTQSGLPPIFTDE